MWRSFGARTLIFFGLCLGSGCGQEPSTDDSDTDDDRTGVFPWDDAIDSSGGPASSRLVRQTLGSTGATQGFYEYTPSGYPGSTEWPLLVALHGKGENGNGTDELTKLEDNGIPKLLAQNNWPIERPFVVLMPQHTGDGRPTASEVQSFIDWAIENYSIDPRYVYLTAYSMGAYGAWGYLQEHLDSQIAAIVPIAGNGVSAWEEAGCDLARVGIWAFHGDADEVVHVGGTEAPMEELSNCSAPPAKETKKTIYPGVTHNSWDQTYDMSEGHDIYGWFLQFSKE